MGAVPARIAVAEPGAVERVASVDWPDIEAHLDTDGYAVVPRMLSADECAGLTGLYEVDERFRSRVVMARHGFGQGEYRYFAYPLPDVVERLRTALYPRLASIANRWNESFGSAARYPGALTEFLERCHGAGQTRPTPLLLRYEASDYNCLHQDLYGEHVFPLQVDRVALEAGRGFHGRRIRSRRAAAPPAVTGRRRAARPGRRRDLPGAPPARCGERAACYRVTMRHGVSRLHSGHRYTVGIIFHDAR